MLDIYTFLYVYIWTTPIFEHMVLLILRQMTWIKCGWICFVSFFLSLAIRRSLFEYVYMFDFIWQEARPIYDNLRIWKHFNILFCCEKIMHILFFIFIFFFISVFCNERTVLMLYKKIVNCYFWDPLRKIWSGKVQWVHSVNLSSLNHSYRYM